MEVSLILSEKRRNIRWARYSIACITIELQDLPSFRWRTKRKLAVPPGNFNRLPTRHHALLKNMAQNYVFGWNFQLAVVLIQRTRDHGILYVKYIEIDRFDRWFDKIWWRKNDELTLWYIWLTNISKFEWALTNAMGIIYRFSISQVMSQPSRILPQSKETLLKSYTKRLKDDVKSILDNFTEIVKSSKVSLRLNCM